MVVAELVDGCNLRCVICPNRFMLKTGEQMSVATVDKVMKRYPNRWIDWFNWGEPVLHKELAGISNRVNHTPSRVSTNLSYYLTDEIFDSLSKFRVMLVSLSGMTEDVYGIYHQGGNFKLVMDNLNRLVRIRKKQIIMNWLSHKHNAHQFGFARTYCNEWGVKFNPTPLICTMEEAIGGFDHELLQTPRFQNTGRTQCRILDWPTIGADGSHLLCCATQNVKIGYTIDDDVTHEQLVEAKRSVGICRTCRERELWRMHS